MSEKNSYESFTEDVNGCLDSCGVGCGICVAGFVGFVMLAEAAAWVRDHPFVSVSVALVIIGGIIYLVRKGSR